MRARNTSFHKLNADKGLANWKKLLWILLNVFNNSYFPNNVKNLNIKNFCPDLGEADWRRIHIKSSPARSLSDLFWLTLDWAAIKSELNNIHILDIGCGKGDYALKLKEFSEGNISRYCGMDIIPNKNWKRLTQAHEFVTFKQQNASNLFKFIPQDTNIIISQSAIEHFENDLLYFQQLKDYINKTNGSIIQIHIFPSSACLKLLLLHGVRQYTPRTVSKITEIFNSHNSYSILFRLGGRYCNKLHYRFITKPSLIKKKNDWRNTKTEEYQRLLKEAVEKDAKSKNYQPNFYALVVHSNYKNKIFETMKSLSG